MRFHVSLNAAWQALLLLVAVVPMVFALSWGGDQVFDLLMDARLAQEAQTNRRIRDHIGNEVRWLVTLAENKSDAMSLVRAKDGQEQEMVRSMAAALGAEQTERIIEDRDFERITGLMDNITSREPAVVSVVLTDRRGAVLAGLYREVGAPAKAVRGTPTGFGFDWEDDELPPAVVESLDGRRFVGSPSFLRGPTTFLVASPVAAGGVLILEVDVASLWRDLGSLATDSSTVTYALDPRGALLHAPAWAGIEAGVVLSSIGTVQALLDGSTREPQVPYIGLAGERVFGLSGTIDDVNWGVVTEIPVTEIVSPIRALLARIAVVIAATVIAFALLGMVLIRRILRPVAALSDSFVQATAGNYAETRSQTTILEIAQLTRGFNTMVGMVGRRETQLLDAQRIASLGRWDWTIASGTLSWSEQIFHIFGLDPDSASVDYQTFLGSIHPEDRGMVIEAIEASTNPSRRAPYSIDHRITTPDGEVRTVHEQGEASFDGPNGEATRMIGTVQDITERVRIQEERNSFSRTLQAILDNSPFGIWMTDPDGRPQFANETLCQKIGRTMEEVLGADHIGELFDMQILNEFSVQQGRGINDKRMRSVYASLVLPERGERDFKITRATIQGEADEIQGFIGIVEDVTEARKLQDQIAHQATHDSLTGLLNRAAFEHKLEQVCRTIAMGDTPHAVCFIDLDRFKVINDTCGHHAGDELLRRLSSLYRSKCRKTEPSHDPAEEALSPALARLGGDEFGLLLYNCPPENAEIAAQRLVDVTREYRFTYEERVFDIGCTIGIAPIEFGNSGGEEAMKQADGACYVAKEKGRGRIHLFRPGDADVDRHQTSAKWAPLITRALEEDGLELCQQAICPIPADEEGDRFEVLVRYRSSVGEVVPPGAFLPAAERFFLMPRVDRWVVKNTFESLEGIYGEGSGRTLVSASINLSGQTLGDSTVLDFIIELFERSPIRPEQICFEITETAAISNLEEATYLIDRLRDLGCRFALDDFGSGLSSFSYLSSMNVDYLKIDGSLVRNIVTDPVSREMVSAIKRVGDVMDIRTVGEWVEDDPIFEALREIGVDFAQGYGLDQPAPLAAEHMGCECPRHTAD